MGGKKKKQVVGYWYGARAHFGIGLAMDELYQIKVGGTRAWTGSVKQNSNIFINASGIFGGEKKEGGVAGTLSVMFGKQDQGLNGYLTGILGNKISAFRGTATTVFDGWFCANNPYPKPWEFCYRRIKNGWPDDSPWYPEKITISLADGKIQAMNPAHMLYESYISDTWGSGEARAKMDDSAWRKAADTLFDEKFGLCLEWKATDELKNFRDMICSHIGAKLSTDPTTGLITIRLIRDDYDISLIPIFDEDHGLLELSQDSTNNTEVPSQVIVKYTDAISFEEQSAHATNPAVAQSQGGRSVETTLYQAIPTSDLATRVAYRDLKIKTNALKRFTLKLDRRAADLVIGEPFRIRTLRRKNNFDVVLRAERIEERFLTDGTINVMALQDVFGLPKVAFNPAPIIPETPRPKPVVVTEKLLIEAPYRELAGLIDEANLQLLNPDSSFFFVLAMNPDSGCQSFNVFSRPKNSANFIEADDLGVWCPTAKLMREINYLDKNITVTEDFMLEDVVVGTAAIIDGEIVRVDKVDITNKTITIGRGCVDTVPAKHKAGARIWFYDGYETTDSKEYISGIIVETKLATNTSTEQLELSKAPIDTITMQARQAKPYPPGNFKINNLAYPEVIEGTSQLVFSWAHRNRLLQADQLIDTTLGNIDLEKNVSYNLSIHANNQLVKQLTNFIGNSFNLNLQEINIKNNKDIILMQYENELSDQGDYSWTPIGVPTYVDGVIGSTALRFNSTDGLTCLESKSIIQDLNFSNNIDFTIECWVRVLDNTPYYGTILSTNHTSFNYNSRFLMFKGVNASPNYQKNKIVFGGYPYSSQTIVSSTTTLELNKWYHVAITRMGNIFTLYINGKKESQNIIDTMYDLSDTGTIIGRNKWDGNNGLFRGDIDQLRITRGCLYSEDFTPSNLPYVFNNGENSVTDISVSLNAVRDELQSWQAHNLSFKLKP